MAKKHIKAVEDSSKAVEDNKPHVIMLQESLLKSTVSKVGLNNYFCHRLDRITAARGREAAVKGGGLLTFVRCCVKVSPWLSHRPLPPIDIAPDDVTEVLPIDIRWFSNIGRIYLQ